MINSNEVCKIIENKVPNRHTFFQLNFFVVGKEPTHQAKLKRCVEELKSRKNQVDGMLMEIDDLNDQNELIYMEINRLGDSEEAKIKCRMIERRIWKNNRTIDELNDRMKNIEEEMLFFVNVFNKLNQEEEMKDWDDLDVQKEYWNAKIAEEVNYRIMMQLPLDIEVIKTALSLPDELNVKKQVFGLLQEKVSSNTISVVA